MSDLMSGQRDRGLGDLADHVMDTMAPAGGYLDDVAMLLYRRPAALRLSIPARPAEIAPARAVLRDWLERTGVDPQLACDVLHATGEAVSNAVEHGNRDGRDSAITLRATATGTVLQLSVSDNGRWKTPDPVASSHRGRGIALMRSLMDDVAVEPGADGTTVSMSVNLR